MTDIKDELTRAASHWNKQKGLGDKVVRWWSSPHVLRHQNRIVCGEPIDGNGAGMRQRLRDMLQGKVIENGLSIGCGNGIKEMALIEEGLVNKFDLFEISSERVKQGRHLAEQRGLTERVTFSEANAFDKSLRGEYQLVYWDNSLHHMFDVREALQWSRDALRQGGYIVVNDFIGQDRFQWSDESLELISRFRSVLPSDFLVCGQTGKALPTKVARPSFDNMIATDPSEAADSSRIVAEAKSIFPNGEWTFLGGMIYHTGLNGLLWNFDKNNSEHLLELCLYCDELLSRLGHNQYGLFLGRI